MSEKSLLDIINDLDTYDNEMTIYACRPWAIDSLAFVAIEPEEGTSPDEMVVNAGVEVKRVAA